MFGKVRIKRHERGLWFRHGDFRRLLGPGAYWMISRLWRPLRDRVQIVSTLETRFVHPLLDVLVERDEIRDALLIVDLNDGERALVWKDDRLAHVLGPGRHAFWREPYALDVETYDVKDLRFEHPRLAAIVQNRESGRYLEGVKVDAHAEVLVYLDGRLIERLTEGLHVFWKGAGQLAFKTIDKREQQLDVAGQEIMTADKVTLRVNLLVSYQVTDPVKAVGVVSDYAAAVYREAQLILRAAIGTRTLDALLSDKQAIGDEVRSALARRAVEFGIVIRSVGLRDIILPGDMKQILNQVIEAEKQAQANLIRRREETAAMRSQANTAKLLADNPTLVRIKELELLQEALAGAKATFVFGAGDAADQLRSLIGREAL